MSRDDIELRTQSNWRGKSGLKPRFFRRKWFGVLLLLLILSGLGGLIVFTIMVAPMREKARSFDLSELRKLEVASIIYGRNGDEMSRLYVLNRTPVPLKEVPQHLIDALVAQEDSRYFSHNGVDYVGIARAVYFNFMTGQETQGASTITQQLARNAFDLKERSYQRKLLEAFLATRIEENYSKSQILEMYLNRIYYGGGFYGIQAACQGYFGKDVGDINIQEGATLCGLIKSPNNIQPLRHPDRAKKERNAVLDRMLTEGYLTRERAALLKASPMVTAPQEGNQRLSYVFDEVRRLVVEQVGEERAAIGGFQIYTTIDQELQKSSEEAVRRRLAEVEKRPGYEHQTFEDYRKLMDDYRRRVRTDQIEEGEAAPPVEYLQGASLTIDNSSGAVLAMVGGRDFIDSMFNRALYTRRPAGTAFLPFVYATAFSTTDIFPSNQVEDAPIDNRRVMIGGLTGILGEWGSEEISTQWTQKMMSLREALVQSRNAVTVRLGDLLGQSLINRHHPDQRDRLIPWMSALEAVKEISVKAGINTPLREYPSTFLGASEVELDELCLAYSTFPNGGLRPAKLHLVERITDSDGKIVFQIPESQKVLVPAIDPVAAYQVHTCLNESLERGTGRGASIDFGLGEFPAAGKTGTHYEFKDLWFVGYTSSVTCGVWVGFDKQKMIYEHAYSNRIALPIWTDTMNAAVERYSASEIPPPPDAERVEVCKRSGMRATDFCFEKVIASNGKEQLVRSTRTEYFRPGTRFDRFCVEHVSEGLPFDIKMFSRYGIGGRAEDGGFTDSGQFAHVESVRLQGLTVIGKDPYNAVQPVLRALPVNDDGTEARKAEVVEPLEDQQPELPIRLSPPPRLFIGDDKSL